MAVHDDSALELDQWSQRLSQALQILDLKVDTDLVRDLAERTARDVSPEAAPLTTFYVGYAAAMASRRPEKSPDQAVQDAADTARRLTGEGAGGGQDRVGWAGTGQ